MTAIFVHDDAKADLRQLLKSNRRSNRTAAGRILALLEELEGNPELLDCLTDHDFGARRDSEFHVSKWQEQWRQGRDLWRLKLWDLEDQGIRFRIVYAFMPVKLRYYVLAIAPREFDYDEYHPISQRILDTYRNIREELR